MEFKTLYGPVRSGRLGLSLGVDLLGKRICSMDCLYCEVGPTRAHTLQRRPYMPAQVILDELHAWKKQHLPRPEHITLGGLGEPCLNSDLPEIIAGCRELFPDIPVAVLTNSTLFHDPIVRRELGRVQVVLPSLDSLIESEFLAVTRPCREVSLAMITSGLLQFRQEYSGRICLEILLLRGLNDSPENLTMQREYIDRLRPDRVDVVTMTRPGSSPQAKAVNEKTLAAWRCELVRLGKESAQGKSDAPLAETQTPDRETASDLLLNSLRRRPQTPGQLSAALGLPVDMTDEILRTLLQKELITPADDFGDDFYRAAL